MLALSRQGLPAIRDEKNFENLTEKGGYIIKDVKGNRDVTIIASVQKLILHYKFQTYCQNIK